MKNNGKVTVSRSENSSIAEVAYMYSEIVDTLKKKKKIVKSIKVVYYDNSIFPKMEILHFKIKILRIFLKVKRPRYFISSNQLIKEIYLFIYLTGLIT